MIMKLVVGAVIVGYLAICWLIYVHSEMLGWDRGFKAGYEKAAMHAREIKQLDDAEVLEMRALSAAREEMLIEEIEKWKSHREWSDLILHAYVELLSSRGL